MLGRRVNRFREDRGEIASVLILLLVAIQVVLLVMHASLVFHGRQVVNAAAQEALAEAQLLEGNTAAGEAAGQKVLSLSSGLFSSSNVTVSRGNETVSVTVTATVDTLIFPVVNNVSAEVSGPTERFLAEADRR